jgi:hypothetical protein
MRRVLRIARWHAIRYRAAVFTGNCWPPSSRIAPGPMRSGLRIAGRHLVLHRAAVFAGHSAVVFAETCSSRSSSVLRLALRPMRSAATSQGCRRAAGAPVAQLRRAIPSGYALHARSRRPFRRPPSVVRRRDRRRADGRCARGGRAPHPGASARGHFTGTPTRSLHACGAGAPRDTSGCPRWVA